MTNDLIRAIYPGFTHISVLKELSAFEILLNGSAELYFDEVDHSKMITGYRNDDRDYLNTVYKRLCAISAYHFRQAKSLDSLGEYLGAMKSLGEAKSCRLAAMESYCGDIELTEQYSERQKSNAKRSRFDPLQKLINKIVAKNPEINKTGLLIEIEKYKGYGVIEDVDEYEISFKGKDDKDGLDSAPISGLKDRLSRAKKKIKSP